MQKYRCITYMADTYVIQMFYLCIASVGYTSVLQMYFYTCKICVGDTPVVHVWNMCITGVYICITSVWITLVIHLKTQHMYMYHTCNTHNIITHLNLVYCPGPSVVLSIAIVPNRAIVSLLIWFDFDFDLYYLIMLLYFNTWLLYSMLYWLSLLQC